MNYFILTEGISPTTTVKTQKKKYKCPYCDDRFERAKLHLHIQDNHEELIPEGYTALRVAFNSINKKTEGRCIICGSVTDWNENKGRYERLCNKPKCREDYKNIAAERNKAKYGTERLQTDPRYAEEVQKKALAGRKISGQYTFSDGGIIQYIGSYERKTLEFLDKVMNCKSEDIVAPGPGIEYEFDGSKHLYLPDFYYVPYNLLIEVKDGGDNPNTHPNRLNRDEAKAKAKEAAVKKLNKFNYIRLTNNDFSQLLGIMSVLKFQMIDQESYDPIMRVNESTLLESSDIMMKLYYISESPDIKSLSPIIPKNYWTDNGYEDNTTPRVCFSTSIEKCLMALGENISDKKFYVYSPVRKYKVYSPTKDQVPDVELTNKKWILEKVDLICLGRIKAIDIGHNADPHNYTYGNGENGELYDWDFKWINKYIINESTVSEDMSGTIAAALPLTPTPIPYESSKDNYYLIKHNKNNAPNYSITKDPMQYSMFSVDPLDKNYYKVYKTNKGQIDKKYLTFKIKDKQTARELYDELAMIESTAGKFFESQTYDDYIYRVLTEGSQILDENQLLFDNRFELVKDFETKLNEDCERLYKYLKAEPITILEEQVNDLNNSQYSITNFNILPSNIDNLENLVIWKNSFDSMTYNQRKLSDDESIRLYGKSNIDRYNSKYAFLIGQVDCDDIITNMNESSSDAEVISYNDWDNKIAKVKELEKSGLVIMVDTDFNLDNNDIEESIHKLKEKWNKYQELPSEKRNISNQTASDIFGIDNENLYIRILTSYLNKLDLKNIGDPESEHPTEDDHGLDMDTISSAKHSTDDSMIDYKSSKTDVLCDENAYFHMLEGLTLKLRNTNDFEKRESIKNEISDLGWNPEIPFSKESYSKIKEYVESYCSDMIEINAEEFLNEYKIETTEQIPSTITSAYLKDKIVPVFVILSRGVQLHSKGIKWFTDSEWSHAAITMDSSLDKMYTFTTQIDNAPNKRHTNGFGIDTKERYMSKDPHMKIKVYALFITPEQKDQIHDALNWYIEHQDETRYSFRTIINILRRKPTTFGSSEKDKCKMVCSQFVYSILQIVNLKLRKTKDSSLISPADIDELTDDARFYVVYQGEIDKYKSKTVDDLCYRLLPTLPMEIYGIEESVTYNEIKIPKSAIKSSKQY